MQPELVQPLQKAVTFLEKSGYQKAVAGREKDWPDKEALLIEQWGKLDHDYIEDWLSQFVDALEKPELLTKVHAIKKKVARLFE